MTITVVTPWFEHPELLEGYAAAVNAGRPDDVVIIDNRDFPVGQVGVFDPAMLVRVLAQPRNLGFARGSNEGLRNAHTDAVLFLNNDVELVDAGWLDAIRGALEPGVLVGPALRHDAHGDVDGVKYPYLDGWCLAGMRADLLELGGFDERYDEPAYYSDNDLCLRARAAGMRLRETRVGLRHLGNATAGPGGSPTVERAKAANRARFEAAARRLAAA